MRTTWILLAIASTLTLGCGVPPGLGGARGAHPCEGYRTDALHRDADGHLWLGCGTDAIGTGLFHSTDGGMNWAEPATDPDGYLETFRTTHVHRSADGLLYIAGVSTTGAERVVSADTTSSPYVLDTVFESQSQTWNSFTVGTFRRSESGFAVAESLTGADLAFRTSDEADWEDGYGWWTDGSSFQILDLDEHDGQFYGVGSTISQPPFAFLPSAAAGPDGFALDPVQLVEGLAEYNGELWSVDVDDGGILAGGVDQDRDVGWVHVSGSEPADPDDWTSFDVSTLISDEPSWVRGVCRDGANLAAVGELSTGTGGFVLGSTDGGSSWTDKTPVDGVPSLQRCVMDGAEIYAAGGEGWFGVL